MAEALRVDRNSDRILLITDRQDQPRYLNADGFKIKVFAFSADVTPERLGPGDGPVLNAEMYVQNRSRALDEFLDQADARLRNQYTLAYYSTPMTAAAIFASQRCRPIPSRQEPVRPDAEPLPDQPAMRGGPADTRQEWRRRP